MLSIRTSLHLFIFDNESRYFHFLTLPQTIPVFKFLLHKSFENTVGKGEIARNEQFLLSPQRFLPFSSNLKLLSASSFSLEESKSLSFGKGLSPVNLDMT